MMGLCACGCGCHAGVADLSRRDEYGQLCAKCWQEWATGSQRHAAPDRTYMGQYSIANPWTAWLFTRAPELVAEPPQELVRGEAPRICLAEDCGHPMTRRPGAYKCYRHSKAIVVLDAPRYQRAPLVNALDAAKEKR